MNYFVSYLLFANGGVINGGHVSITTEVPIDGPGTFDDPENGLEVQILKMHQDDGIKKGRRLPNDAKVKVMYWREYPEQEQLIHTSTNLRLTR